MDFEELMKLLEGVEFEGRDNFISGMNNLSAGATARITELETSNAELQAELQRTQADNYKLIQAQTAKAQGSDEPEEKEEITEEDKDVTKLIED